jgi:hypothetical protein
MRQLETEDGQRPLKKTTAVLSFLAGLSVDFVLPSDFVTLPRGEESRAK